MKWIRVLAIRLAINLAIWVILFFIPKNQNDVMALVEFQLIRTFITNQEVLLETIENITQNAAFKWCGSF